MIITPEKKKATAGSRLTGVEHALLGALGAVIPPVLTLGALARLLDVRLDLGGDAHLREHHVEPGAVLTKRRE